MQNTSLTPKNVFLQIGILATLYFCAVDFLVFLFEIIDKTFPPANVGNYYYDDGFSGLRFAVSSLIVLFPLFIWLSSVYRKFSIEHAEIKESRLRKWFMYTTLFVAAATMVTDLIVVINTFLNGEDFATGFVLKAASVFVVAFAIFSYGLKDLKGYFDQNPKMSKIWLTVTSVVVALAVIGGLVVMGSPAVQRMKGYDRQREAALSDIDWRITEYFQTKQNKLPVSIDEAFNSTYGVVPLDPETKLPYKYSVVDKDTYELCATFSLATDEKAEQEMYMRNEWKHGVGETCFKKDVVPNAFPMNGAMMK